MTPDERQKLAETVRDIVRRVSGTGDVPAIDAALAALAQPCQECVRLEAEVERWERQQIRPQEIIDRLLAAEAEVAALREKLAREAIAFDAVLCEAAALRERLAEAEARWQEAEHPFDKPEYDRMYERAVSAERQLEQAREALHVIGYDMPLTERNPDGDEQAAHSMQQAARDAIRALAAAEHPEQTA